jgi:phage terminase small subunit
VALTPKQRRFIDEYCVDFNSFRAAIRAGFKNAAYGMEVLRRPEIAAEIEDYMHRARGANVASAEEVEAYLTRVMRGESEAEVVVVEGQGRGVTAARQVTKRPDEKERLKAAEMLARRLGLFVDRVTVEGCVQVTINDDLGE